MPSSLIPPLPDIDPVEAMLVEVGVDAIISRKVEKVGVARLRRAARLPREIATLARRLVNDDLDSTIPQSAFEWRTAVTELTAGWDVQQVIAMLRQFPAEYQATASALLIKSIKLIQDLTAGLPLDRYQTFAGSKDMIPADAHIFKFASVLEVVRDPLVVFRLMAGGTLLKLQANAVRETYPSIAAAIDAAIFTATVAAKAAKKSFELAPRAEYGVRAWMGQSPVSGATLKHAQATVAVMNDRKKSQVPPAKPATGLMTAAQRAEAKPGPTP